LFFFDFDFLDFSSSSINSLAALSASALRRLSSSCGLNCGLFCAGEVLALEFFLLA